MGCLSRITVSTKEREAGLLSADNMTAALSALRQDGVVMLERLFEPSLLTSIARKMTIDLEREKREGMAWSGGGKLIGHLNAVPPTTPEFLTEQLLLNPILFALSQSVFDKPVLNIKFTSNVNLPGSVRQSFHPDFRALDDIDQLNISVPLCDVSERNGSTEVVPGTYRIPFTFKRLEQELQSRRAERANASVGSAMLWFPSLWHRGTANASADPRHMITLTHAPVGSKSHEAAPPTQLPESAKALVRGRENAVKATFSAISGDTVFTPNYFKPTFVGRLRESLHAVSPRTNEFLMKHLGK